MGMFDSVICHYELPDLEEDIGIHFQSKCTEEQYCSTYVISMEGDLWLHKHDQIVRNDKDNFFGFSISCINFRIERCFDSSDIEIHHYVHETGMYYSFVFVFEGGSVQNVYRNYDDW